MSKHKDAAQILDLTDSQTLFELAVEGDELYGRHGAKLIADMKERAGEAEYTHMYYRDPIRPGIVWFSQLNPGTLPTRGKLENCRSATEKVFPGFLDTLRGEMDPAAIMAQIPPITKETSGLELVSALEYLVFVYPSMVRAWASLMFAYGEMLHMKHAVDAVYNDCVGTCPHAQVVTYLMSPANSEEGSS